MTIPNQFRLFSQIWRIRIAHLGEIGDDLGQCRPDQTEILINPQQLGESTLHTLMHEIVHAIELKLLLELTENQVDLIALGLVDLIRSNPGIFEGYQNDKNNNE